MIRYSLLIGLVLAGCRSIPAAAPPQVQSTEFESRLDALLEDYRKAEHIPGLAMAVVKDGEVVYLDAFGERDLERHLPVTVDTLFGIGSCTKAFTAMAVLIAQDEQRLLLDDHPRRFLPDFRMADPQADAAVTLRDLLSHRSGLAPRADLAAEPGVLTRAEYVRAATSARPAAPFRSSFQYSNAGYSTAGEVLGVAYQSSWEQVVEEKLLRPLGMTSSRSSVLEKAKVPNHAVGYQWNPAEERWIEVPPPASLRALAPGGSIASTARDMVQWLRLLTSNGRLGERRLVSEAGFREALTPHTAMDPHASYTLGWARYEWEGLEVFEHSGGSRGLSALVSFIPEKRIGLILLANTAPGRLNRRLEAARLVFPLLLEISPSGASPTRPPPAEADEPPTFIEKGLPSAEELLPRMIHAAGGEATLRRHRSMELRGLKRYEHHGVQAQLVVRASAPAHWEEQEVWMAAGREIGKLRIYFDGRTGGQETTFGQDALNDEAANRIALTERQFHPLLSLRPERLQTASGGLVLGEPTYLLQTRPDVSEHPLLLWVSRQSGRVLQRQTASHRATFEDFRRIDGEQVPFRTTLFDALGETTVQVTSVEFNVPLPEQAFAPHR